MSSSAALREQYPTLSRPSPRPFDERYEANDLRATPEQRQQRQQPPSRFSPSRPSSSSGSTQTLRRTPRLQLRPTASNRPSSPVLPEASAGPPQSQPVSNYRDGSSTPQSTGPNLRRLSYWPTRSRPISKHTAEAILYALEAIRGDPEGRLGSPAVSPSQGGLPQWKARQFTRDLAEEDASMSSITGGGGSNGRPPNGGSRAAAVPGEAVPVPPYATEESPRRMRTPTDVMRARHERNERNKKREEDERRLAEEEDVQRRAREEQENIQPADLPDPVGVADLGERDRARAERRAREARRSATGPGQTSAERRTGERGSGGATVVNPVIPEPQVALPYPTTTARGDRTSNALRDSDPATNQPPKTRTSRVLSTGEPRPVEPRGGRAARPPSGSAIPGAGVDPNIPQPRQTSRGEGGASQSRGPYSGFVPPGQPPGLDEAFKETQQQQQRNTKSSFPHAFERWENLSAHWEGLTSFWMRRLEQNKDELSKGDLNQQLARQVTDLSAAGANLFHAVVELQRLRASSERKFQRWFFETRDEQERSKEIQGKLEEQLRIERQAQQEAATSSAKYDKDIKAAYAAKNTADVQVREMRRELTISKDEARRAWEELGRMVQEERDRTTSLRNGEPTLVGGVQVVPMMAGMSRQGSTNRPPTRDGPPSGSATRQPEASQRNPGDDPAYTSYDPARSDTDTDPFTESGRADQQVREDPNLPTSGRGYQQTSESSSAAALQASRSSGTQSSPQQSQGVRTTTTTTTTSTSLGGSGSNSRPERSTQATSQPGSTSFYQHEGSSLNPDDRGQLQSFEGDERSFVPSVEDNLSDDEWSLDSANQIKLDAQGNPVRSRRAPASENSDELDVQEAIERERMYGRSYGSGIPGVEYGSGPTTPGTRAPDYTGSGYGFGWEAMPRHHHPTRLSDVLEEDERSRTSPSRASQTSRGIR